MFDPVEALVSDFDFYLGHFRTHVLPRWPNSRHAQTILRRREFPNAIAAVTDVQFMSQLRETLRTDFGLQRTDVKNSLIVPDALRADIERLETCRIESATRRDLDLLWSVIQSLRLNSKRAKVVINTKALAHVLTELVVPIDRRYTGAFLFRFASEFDDDTTEMLLFYTAYSAFRRIAQRINLQEYVSISPSASDWNTTRPKIIDNAIIGFVEYARANLSPPQGMT